MCLSRAPALSVLVFARAERRIQQDLVPCADFCVMIQQHRGLGNVCTTCAVQYVYHCTSACRVLNRGGVGFSACARALWERRVAVPQAISYPITLVWSSKVTHTPFPSPVCHHSLLPCRPVPHPVSHCSTKFRVDNSVITQTLEMRLGSDENCTLELTYPVVS